MKKLSTVIVDDEALAIDLLKSYLAEFEEIDVVAECRTGKEAISAVMELSPDLMFLDIQMPGMTGFDVIRELQSDVSPLVVFVTAYDQFALDAFDVHAVDYVLKPLDTERIHRAILRCLERVKPSMEHDDSKHQIIGAINEIAQKVSGEYDNACTRVKEEGTEPSKDGKIVVKDRDEITLLDQADIKWVDAAGDYMCLHVKDETHIMRSTMKNLLSQLDPARFKRVHRSTIVNLNSIQRIIPQTKGEYILQLGEHEKIKVSRNYRDVVKEFLSD